MAESDISKFLRLLLIPMIDPEKQIILPTV